MSRPNIILISADQHRADCFGYRGRNVKTPNLDKLAADGMVFTNAITPCVVCMPARTGMRRPFLAKVIGCAVWRLPPIFQKTSMAPWNTAKTGMALTWVSSMSRCASWGTIGSLFPSHQWVCITSGSSGGHRLGIACKSFIGKMAATPKARLKRGTHNCLLSTITLPGSEIRPAIGLRLGVTTPNPL